MRYAGPASDVYRRCSRIATVRDMTVVDGSRTDELREAMAARRRSPRRPDRSWSGSTPVDTAGMNLGRGSPHNPMVDELRGESIT